MEHHAWRSVIRQFLEPRILPRAVSVVAHEQMAEELKMHADLMRAPGVDLRLDERGGVQPFENFVARMRRATGIIVERGHAFAMRRMPRNRRADFTGFTREFTAQNRVVNFFDFAGGK